MKKLKFLLTLAVISLIVLACQKEDIAETQRSEQGTTDVVTNTSNSSHPDYQYNGCNDALSGHNYRIKQTPEDATYVQNVKAQLLQYPSFDYHNSTLANEEYGVLLWDAGMVGYSQSSTLKTVSVPYYHPVSEKVTGFLKLKDDTEEIKVSLIDRGIHSYNHTNRPNTISTSNENQFRMFDYSLCQTPELDLEDDNWEDPAAFGEGIDCVVGEETLHFYTWIECVLLDDKDKEETRGWQCNYWEYTPWTMSVLICGGTDGGVGGANGPQTGGGGGGGNGGPIDVVGGGSGGFGFGGAGSGGFGILNSMVWNSSNFIKSFVSTAGDYQLNWIMNTMPECLYSIVETESFLEENNTSPESIMAANCYLLGLGKADTGTGSTYCEEYGGSLEDNLANAQKMAVSSNLMTWVNLASALNPYGSVTDFGDIPCKLLSLDWSEAELNELNEAIDEFLGTPPLVQDDEDGIDDNGTPMDDTETQEDAVIQENADKLNKLLTLVTTYTSLKFNKAETALLLSNNNLLDQLEAFIIENEGSEESIGYANLITSLKAKDNEILFDRSKELFDLIKENPDQLVTNCGDVSAWSELASFVPPPAIEDRIEDLGEGWRIQYFLTPTLAPRLNLDYFSSTISQMPIKDQNTGELWSHAELFEYFRKNINDFINADNEFVPYSTEDETLWLSDDPFGTLITIDINVPNSGGNIPTDDGSIICSQFQDCCWLFSTVTAPFLPASEDGFHPVSGNRQFGYISNPDGSMEIYTRGADRFFYPPVGDPYRVDKLLAYLLEKPAFAGADALWDSFQEGVVNYAENNGGNATKGIPIKNRPKAKDELKNLLKQNFPITNVPCAN